MERLQLALVVLVVVAVAVIGATVFLATGPVGPVAGLVDRAPSPGDVQRAQERLSQGARLSVAAPLANVWTPGTSGSFILGMSNDGDAFQNFRLAFIVEGVAGKLSGQAVPAGAAGWFSAQELLTVGPGGSATTEVRVGVPADAVEGIYLFRALLCTGEPCSADSAYASLQLPIEVRA